MLIDLSESRNRMLKHTQRSLKAMVKQLGEMSSEHPQRHLIEGLVRLLQKKAARLSPPRKTQ